MAFITHGAAQIIKKFLYLYQINLDLYQTLNLAPGVPTYFTNLSDPHGLMPNGYYETGGSPNYQEMYLSLPNYSDFL